MATISTIFLRTNWSNFVYKVTFYRAMHFSAKRGLAIACRLSVRLSVTLVDCDHIGWNSSKIISPSVSLGCLLSATQTSRVYSKVNTPKFSPKVTHPFLIWASESGDIRSQIAAEWLQIAQRRAVTRHNVEPIGNHHRSFEWCHRWPPTTSLSPKWGFQYAPRYANGHISVFRNGWSDALHVWF